VHISQLSTPAVIIDRGALRRNIETMTKIHPGSRLRPHVKAHKCTSLAREQYLAGHHSFTCATPAEVLGMARAGVGDDLLLANEVLDASRLSALADAQNSARITVAVDSDSTIDAAAVAGIENVVIDVNVGLPRCGCAPTDAGRLAERARTRGMNVRGVMGYEGHLMMVADRDDKRRQVHEAMSTLVNAARDVGGDIISAGGTGTYDMFEGTGVTEVQAGSYALMDTHYATLGLPFEQAMWVVGSVISENDQWKVLDVGLKALGMDHGNPSLADNTVWFCSDEHLTFSGAGTSLGDRVRVTPAHIDPTMAMHSVAHIVENDLVVDTWPIDLRGW
jgi:D-serine deaminase-like pyridoxal phosphate-dependent protein